VDRIVDAHLDDWTHSKYRKPLLLRGARQVGKTYSARKLGRQFSNLVEVNFELTPGIKNIFQVDLKPDRIIRDLSIALDTAITPGQSLLFFDEIQECPEAIKSLRYFYELCPQLHIVAAGSLLEFKVSEIGLPVGRVDTLYIYPLSFYEFLLAKNQSRYVDVIKECVKTLHIEDIHHSALMRLLAEYLAVGGMPESLNVWVNEQDYGQTFAIQRSLIETYRQDFDRYAKKHQIKYIEKLFTEVPGLIGGKFKYSKISGQFRKRELAPALELLGKAGLIHQINHSPGNFPIAFGSDFDKFKLLFIDVALTQILQNISPGQWIYDPLGTLANRGMIAEAFIGQELLAHADPHFKAQLFYWHREARSSNAEIDYLVQWNEKIIPIEVKSGKEGRMKSLREYLKQQTPEFALRFYGGLPNNVDCIRSLPLYCLFATICAS
jgi:uncharacterized protein